MSPLSLDDLMPLEEYARGRRKFFESHRRYLDRYRRVRIGPSAALLFENRQTLWFRVQEVIRIARLVEPREIQRELDLLNRLLPEHGQLQAALVVDTDRESRATHEFEAWDNLTGNVVRLCLGKDEFPARPLTCRPEDRCFGAVHWLQFELDDAGRKRLNDLRCPATIRIALRDYQHVSATLSDDIRQSLIDDLAYASRSAKMAA